MTHLNEVQDRNAVLLHTLNPWRGCTKVSPACDHCYGRKLRRTYALESPYSTKRVQKLGHQATFGLAVAEANKPEVAEWLSQEASK